MVDLFYFVVICEETDMFEGKIVHVNEKAKSIEEVHQLVKSCVEKYPLAHWELYPCSIKVQAKN